MRKRVIIVGGGFGGLNAAKALAGEDVDVLLFDRRNHHLFQPLLYQVATAGLNPSDIAVPIRAQFADAPNIEVHLAEIRHVDLKGKQVASETGRTVSYDFLILACGARHSYFDHPEWEVFAPGLKTVEHATEIRRRILLAFELAENEFDPAIQNSLLTFVIVGGGPTGVELAGAIADIARTVLVKDFKRIDPSLAKVLLIEAGDRVLAQFSPSASARALKDLRALGVDVLLSTRVDHIDAEGLRAGDKAFRASNVIWAAGVQAEKIGGTLGSPVDRAGRIVIGPDLSIPGHPEVFVVGDLAHLEMENSALLPGLAPAAIQTGCAAAENILRDLRGQPREKFRYVDKGQMATIGKRRAVAEIGRLRFSGIVAWLAWLFVHVLYLIGFKNRISVLFDWTWSYLFSKRGARLITRRDWTSS